MIIGTGIDLIKIDRIKSITKMEYFFTKSEISFFNKTSNYDTLAGAFAAKEALLKALAVGIESYKFTEMEILHKSNGAPYFNFYGKLDEKIKKERLSCLLSIAHDGDYAIANVIVLKK